MEKLSGPEFVCSLEASGVRLRVSGRHLIAKAASPEQLAELERRRDEIFRLVKILQQGGQFFSPLCSDGPLQSQAEM